MDTETTIEIIDEAVLDISLVIGGGLTAVIGLAAVLIGLFFLWRLIVGVFSSSGSGGSSVSSVSAQDAADEWMKQIRRHYDY